MSFQREEFYGFDFKWFGVDKNGHLAEFISGYGPIPEVVFADEQQYKHLADFFKDLYYVTTARLTTKTQLEQENGSANYEWFLEESQKGLYTYIDKIDTESYKLISIPYKKLHINSLPLPIQTILEPLKFQEINFETMELFMPTFFVACSD